MLGFDAIAALPLASLPDDGTVDSLAVTPATLTFTGQTIVFADVAALLPATLEMTGQVLALADTDVLSILPATVEMTGQNVEFSESLILVLDPATLTITGQAITLRTLEPSAVRAGLLVGESGQIPRSYWIGMRRRT